MKGKIISINISKEKGTSKKPVEKDKLVKLKENFGIVDDAHSGTEKEVSFLGWETVVEWLRDKSEKLKTKINPGDFAENITTEGINWQKAKIGSIIEIANSEVILKVSHIGKSCHSYCNIKKLVGDCIMPKNGVFAKVIKGGNIK
ncbi:MAG: MOSC domain-containing protein, partial [Endomicrobiia bacterium]